MAFVWKLPDNKSRFWIARFTAPDGRRLNRSTKQTDRRKAMAVAEAWQDAADKARLCELTQAASIKVLDELMQKTTRERLHVKSIATFLREWIQSRERLGRADATAKRYRGIAENFLKHLGEQRGNGSIASLTAGEVEAWRNAEILTGKGKTTADFGVKVIRGALNIARRQGLTLANVSEAVESAGGHAEEREVFTDDELASLFEAANAEWRGMILFGAWCGLRIGDAASLTWECVDIETGILTFHPSKTRNKDGAPLRVAMHGELLAHLKTLPRGIGKAPLFPSLHGRKPGSHGGLSNEFSRLMQCASVVVRKGKEKTGVGRRFNSKGFHALRHTMISRMANANVSSDVRRAMAGHSSDEQHRKYVHLNIDTQRTAVATLARISR